MVKYNQNGFIKNVKIKITSAKLVDLGLNEKVQIKKGPE